jgi:hypothetical protein
VQLSYQRGEDWRQIKRIRTRVLIRSMGAQHVGIDKSRQGRDRAIARFSAGAARAIAEAGSGLGTQLIGISPRTLLLDAGGHFGIRTVVR